MDKYFNSFREMISLRGLTDHTLKAYSTYIRVYLDYLENILHKLPDEVSWAEQRDFIRWLAKNKSLSDRTINCAISQLRFFTIYVLHKPWDDTQLPLRKFDTFIPFTPTKEEVLGYFSVVPDLKEKAMLVLMYSSGPPGFVSAKSIFFVMKISTANRCVYTSAVRRIAQPDMQFSQSMPWICLLLTMRKIGVPM